jgi:prepilin-type N-terminal cleavage/methylation domain-containing protein
VRTRSGRVWRISSGSPGARRSWRGAALGYTLIEVMLVLVIIGILTCLAVVHIAETKEHAYVAMMESDLNNLESAEESYFVEFNTYTLDMPVDRFMPSTNDTYTITSATFTGWSAVVTRLNDVGAGVNTCHLASGTGEMTATEWPGAPYCP